MTALLLALVSLQRAPDLRAVERDSWDGFPVLVWRQRHREAGLPEELAIAFGGTNVEGADEARAARAAGLTYYVGHGPGRNDLHLDATDAWRARVDEWVETRDPALLVRAPCLSDPEVRDRLRATLDRTLAARGGDHGLGVSLGDEVSLTPAGAPFDLCRSATCLARWRERARLGDLPEEPPSTDAVRLALGRDDFSLLGPWLELRRHQHDLVLETLDELAQRARTRAPGVRLGLLGLAGRTAFGNVSVPAATDRFDFVEPYPVGAARELAFTRRGPSTRVLATIGIRNESPDRAAWRSWEHWLRGGDGLVLWSDAILEDDRALRERLAATTARLRDLAVRFPGRPRQAGVALLHDADAVAAAWLRDALLDGPTWPHRLAGHQERHGRRERSVRTFLRLFEDAGFLPGALPLGELDDAATARFPVLLAPHLLVLDDGDVRALERHLDAGGVLVVDGELGWVDRTGARRGEGEVLRSLSERAGERLLHAPNGFAEYLEARDRGRVPRLAAFAAEVLAAAGLSAPEGATLLDADVGIRWLVGTRVLEDGRQLVVLLPNGPARPARGEAFIALALAPGAPPSVEWIHPEPDETGRVLLPPGDAAVLLLDVR